ncbi:MAG: GNAT family N-acetyltransferase [Solirubrobacteraceae bacterium]
MRRVRDATHADVPALVEGIGELLAELGGLAPPADQLADAAHALIENPDAGAVLVAESDGQLVGVLGVSWQSAIRIPGSYGLIQELWIRPGWRGNALGGELLAALYRLAGERGIGRIEVGLPSERFAGLAKTEAFYRANDFEVIGTRLRRQLS